MYNFSYSSSVFGANLDITHSDNAGIDVDENAIDAHFYRMMVKIVTLNHWLTIFCIFTKRSLCQMLE